MGSKLGASRTGRRGGGIYLGPCYSLPIIAEEIETFYDCVRYMRGYLMGENKAY